MPYFECRVLIGRGRCGPASVAGKNYQGLLPQQRQDNFYKSSGFPRRLSKGLLDTTATFAPSDLTTESTIFFIGRPVPARRAPRFCTKSAPFLATTTPCFSRSRRPIAPWKKDGPISCRDCSKMHMCMTLPQLSPGRFFFFLLI